MRIKNTILLIFVLFALNLFYQPIQVNRIGNKHTIVRQINYEEDKLTFEIIKKSNYFLAKEFISISYEIRNKNTSYFNTS